MPRGERTRALLEGLLIVTAIVASFIATFAVFGSGPATNSAWALIASWVVVFGSLGWLGRIQDADASEQWANHIAGQVNCPDCTAVFFDPDSFAEHQRREHPDMRSRQVPDRLWS